MQNWLGPKAPAPSALGRALLPGGGWWEGCSTSQDHTCALPRCTDPVFHSLAAALTTKPLGPHKMERKTPEAAPPLSIRNWGFRCGLKDRIAPREPRTGPLLSSGVLCPPRSCLAAHDSCPAKPGQSCRGNPRLPPCFLAGPRLGTTVPCSPNTPGSEKDLAPLSAQLQISLQQHLPPTLPRTPQEAKCCPCFHT